MEHLDPGRKQVLDTAETHETILKQKLPPADSILQLSQHRNTVVQRNLASAFNNLGDLCGGFHIWGYPQSSSIFIGFPIINHPAIGVPPWLWNPHRQGSTSRHPRRSCWPAAAWAMEFIGIPSDIWLWWIIYMDRYTLGIIYIYMVFIGIIWLCVVFIGILWVYNGIYGSIARWLDITHWLTVDSANVNFRWNEQMCCCWS